MTEIPFTKMVGTGNDFILVDTMRRPQLAALSRRWGRLGRDLCDRRRGVGADGLLVLEPSAAATVRMRIFNPDGSEAQMCGNGARCVALYAAGRSRANGHPLTIESGAGVLSASVRGQRVGIRMTDPTDIRMEVDVAAAGRRWHGSFVNTGVPHLVIPVPRVDAIDVDRVGRALRRHRAFAPHGTNVDFIQRRHRGLLIRTYERGVEAETLACGTGMVAAAVVHALDAAASGARRRIRLQPRSGESVNVTLAIGRGTRVTDIILEGAARAVFDGRVTWGRR